MSAINEEVYETSDLPEHDQHLEQKSNEEQFENDNIERIHIDVEAAFGRFKGRNLDTANVDFSDNVVGRKRRGYGGGAYVLELIGADLNESETVEQKFNRLTLEAGELTEQLQQIKNSSEGDINVSISCADVQTLQQQLKCLEVDRMLGPNADISITDPQNALARKLSANIEQLKRAKTKAKGDDNERINVVYNVTDCTLGMDQKFASLEERLRRIELSLGNEHSFSSIGDRLEQFGRILQTVEPGHLEGLDARMTAILHKFGQLQSKRTDIKQDGHETDKVSQLHQMMTKWDGQCAALSSIVERLHSLQNLHEQAMHFSQTLTQVDNLQQQVAKCQETDAKLLSEVRTGLADNMERLKTNCLHIEKRLSNLDK